MDKNHLISQELVRSIKRTMEESLPAVGDSLKFELQDDFQFLLISIELDLNSNLKEEERRKVARRIDKLMPTREGELTWMLNFTRVGEVEDSYFGGDSKSPEIGF